MPRTRPLPFAALLVLVVGCSGAKIESAHFGASSEIERAIMLYYDRNASEGGCFRPTIDGFTRLEVVEDTPARLVVHARYLWRDRFQGGGGDGGQVCQGFGDREFTLARSTDGAPVVVAMTGEQDEPAIRSLIRRLFSS